MHDLRGNYILFLNKHGTTSYGLSSLFSYVSAKLRNAPPDFICSYEFIGFKRESRAAFCTAAFLFNEYIFQYYVFSSDAWWPRAAIRIFGVFSSFSFYIIFHFTYLVYFICCISFHSFYFILFYFIFKNNLL